MSMVDTIRSPRQFEAPALTRSDDDHGDPVQESAAYVRSFLQQSGPLFAGLALYLSSRLDTLPAEYCREFELTPDDAPALPPSAVKRIVASELGINFGRRFAKFDFNHLTSGLFVQTHAAVLRTGEAVSVMLSRPEYGRLIGVDEIRQVLRAPALREFYACFVTEELVADFLSALRRATDLRLRGEAMEVAFSDTAQTQLGTTRKVYSELSGQHVLTVSDVETTYVTQILETATHNGQRLARNLCQRWLYETFCRRFCPVDPRLRNTILLDQSLIFAGNEFAEIPQRTKNNLLSYLLATLVDDPDKAARSLLQEMVPPLHGVREPSEFRSNFRQAAYFGALEPVLGTDTNALPQLIFQHWKTAIEHGYTPTPHLLCFYRGLFSTARAARQLAPGEDSLRQGMEDLDATIALDRFSEFVNLGHWSQSLDKFATAMANLPRDLDDALTRAAESSSDDSLRNHGPFSRAHRPAWARGLALLASVVFILQLDSGAWTERTAILALMIAGLAALRPRDR